jgi:glycosyltransferase involved in cell wall biosynthesis
MAMGKAIIASNLEQIGAVIRDGENGLLMEPGDSAGLAAKILKLAGDTDLRCRLGAQARKDVVARYTWTMNAERVLRRVEEGRS